MTETNDIQSQLVHFKTEDPYELRHALRGLRMSVNKINGYIIELEALNAKEITGVVEELGRMSSGKETKAIGEQVLPKRSNE